MAKVLTARQIREKERGPRKEAPKVVAPVKVPKVDLSPLLEASKAQLDAISKLTGMDNRMEKIIMKLMSSKKEPEKGKPKGLKVIRGKDKLIEYVEFDY